MERIIRNQAILGGKPIIRGTRISVDFILELVASGMTIDDIVDEYPKLTINDVRAALVYASQSLKKQDVVFT